MVVYSIGIKFLQSKDYRCHPSFNESNYWTVALQPENKMVTHETKAVSVSLSVSL